MRRDKNKLKLALALAFAAVFLVSILYYLVLRDAYLRNQPTSVTAKPGHLYDIKRSSGADLSKPQAVGIASGRVFSVNSKSALVMTSRDGRPNGQVKLLKKNVTLTPHDIAVDNQGRIYISVSPINRVLVYNFSGRLLGAFPKRSRTLKKQDRLVKPVGLWVNGNRIYITDVARQDIKVFNLEGDPITVIGGPGGEGGRFAFPNGLATSKDDSIYVCDSNNSRVQVLDSKGNFKSFLEPPKESPFIRPKDVAIDSLGRIHVVDTFRNQVYVFRKNNRFLFTYGKAAQTPLAFPNGIAIDEQTGLIFISDRLNDRLSVWGEDNGGIFKFMLTP